MEKWCPKCAKPNPLANQFCGGCGCSLNSLSTSKTNQNSNQNNQSINNQPLTTFIPFSPKNEDDDDYNHWDNASHLNIRLDGLELEPSRFNPVKETIGSLQSNPVRPEEVERKTAPGPYSKMKKKDFIKLFKKELESGPKKTK